MEEEEEGEEEEEEGKGRREVLGPPSPTFLYARHLVVVKSRPCSIITGTADSLPLPHLPLHARHLVVGKSPSPCLWDGKWYPGRVVSTDVRIEMSSPFAAAFSGVLPAWPGVLRTEKNTANAYGE